MPLEGDGPDAQIASSIREGVVLQDAQGLRFADERVLVQCAAEYLVQTEGPLLTSEPRACFERLHDLWAKEIGKEDTVCGRALASLHNAGDLDAFAWATSALGAGANVFKILFVLERAIIHLVRADAASIYRFFVSHYEQVKNDLARGTIYTGLRAWFSVHPDLARSIKRLHEEHRQEATQSLYAAALLGLSLNDFAAGHALILAASASSELFIAGPAVHALGLEDYSQGSRRAALNETISACAELVQAEGSALAGEAVTALGRLVALDEDVIVNLLDQAARARGRETLFALSSFLFLGEKSLRSKPWFWRLTQHLSATEPAHKGTINNIDMLLMGWPTDAERLPLCLEFLDRWLLHHALGAACVEEAFPSTVQALGGVPHGVSQIVTRWLLHEDPRCPAAARGVIAYLQPRGMAALALDRALVDALDEAGIRLLIRRMLGYLFNDEVLLPLVFSLVHTQDAERRTFGFVASVLQQELGYDYPTQTIDYLKAKQEAEGEPTEVKALCAKIIASVEAHLARLEALPVLKEFRPASAKARRFVMERQLQMSAAMEEARKTSIFGHLATHVPLKAGRRTFQAIDDRYSQPSELKALSHEVAIPRREVSDPAGAALRRLLYRSASRSTP